MHARRAAASPHTTSARLPTASADELANAIVALTDVELGLYSHPPPRAWTGVDVHELVRIFVAPIGTDGASELPRTPPVLKPMPPVLKPMPPPVLKPMPPVLKPIPPVSKHMPPVGFDGIYPAPEADDADDAAAPQTAAAMPQAKAATPSEGAVAAGLPPPPPPPVGFDGIYPPPPVLPT